jgi:nucleoside-diphosphate-sugar epimerase
VRRLISQSLAEWVYRPGRQPYTEESPLDVQGEATSSVVVDGIVALEHSTLGSPPLEGVVLRYGQFYGPGTINTDPAGEAPLHVDDAARAALLAIACGAPGIYNIAEETGVVSSAKARRELGWEPGFRLQNR